MGSTPHDCRARIAESLEETRKRTHGGLSAQTHAVLASEMITRHTSCAPPALGSRTRRPHRALRGMCLVGVCVGAQLLMDDSEEDGFHDGLGWIQGKVKRFSHELKIPQIGWNSVTQQKKNLLFKNVSDEMHFYFVHSYHLEPANSDQVLGITNYGYDFASVVCKDNLWGVQFHPEKSQNAGLQLLKNFCTLT